MRRRVRRRRRPAAARTACAARRQGAARNLRARGCCLMRILFAIPHYFCPNPTGHYGAERSTPEERALATRLCVSSLRHNFSEAQGLLDGLQRQIHPANRDLSATITIALCTTGDSHLVAQLADCGVDHVRT